MNRPPYPSLTAVVHGMVKAAPSGLDARTVADLVGKPYATLMSPVTRRIAASASSFCLLSPRHSSTGTAAPKIWRGPPATPGLPCASARGASPAMRR